MTLVDAGPLVALVNSREADHEKCLAALETLEPPLVTTWAAFTEAMHIVWRRTGYQGQAALWRLVGFEELKLSDLGATAVERSAALMEKYADLPMDLADATLVALAESLNESLIFTLDSDFEVHRLHGRRKFKIVP